VEIIRSNTQTPSPAWERFVVTGKARAEIRKFIRTKQREEFITLGRNILSKDYKKEAGKELKDKDLEPVLEAIKRKTAEDIFAEIGEGILNRNTVLDILLKRETTDAKKDATVLERIKNRQKEKGDGMPIKGLIPGMAIHFAGCCHPIPGDKIVGIVTTGRGVTIHTTDCDTLENFTETPERWIDVSWDTSDVSSHIGRIRAVVSHETGGLAALANSIARDDGNISNFKIINRTPDAFEILIDVQVADVQHLNQIIANLRTQSVVQSATRYHD
jgi:GTP diphosphokinase / guanosine-3',5'-bis(diphosphate) 3'-diphosphatase